MARNKAKRRRFWRDDGAKIVAGLDELKAWLGGTGTIGVKIPGKPFRDMTAEEFFSPHSPESPHDPTCRSNG